MGFSSQAGQIILRSQTAQGTYNADTGTAGVGMKLRSGALGPNRDLLIPDPEIGGGRDVVDGYLGAVSWGGDYEFYSRWQSLPTLLRAVMGSASSAVATGIVTDTITPLDTSALPYLSIEETVGGLETYTYYDAVCNTLHLESDANGYMMGTAGIIAARQTAGASKTATPVWDNDPMTVGTNITATYNAVALPAKSFSFDINNNFEDDDFRLGSFYIGDLTPKRREITAGFQIRHTTSSALWRQAVYGVSSATTPGGITTKQQLIITATSYEDIVGGTPTTKNSLTITAPNFVLSPFALEQSGDDVLENAIDGQAVRPNPATAAVTVVVKRAGTVASIK